MVDYRGTRRFRFEMYFALMPIHAWMIRGRATRTAYCDLKRTELLDQQGLRSLQGERLSAIVKHAYETSDFYRRRFDALKIDPNAIKSVDDLSRLPFLEKDDVRENLETGLISKVVPRKRMLRINTSGSTGRPFTIYADQAQLEARFASTLRSLEWAGWKFGDRQVRLWHQTLGMSRLQVVREKIDAWFMRRLFIPAFEISPSNVETFVSKIRNYQPVLVDGYAESLNFLATYINSGNQAGFSPTAVMSSAQALPENTREIIEKGFQTKVFDKYGSREFSGIAYECSAHSGHHVVDECYIVELLVDGRPARPGEVGEIVITDLFNRATPMIRYRIGDLAVAVDNKSMCGCGLAHSRIGDIEGRTQAIVHCADGTWLPGTFFAHFFKDFEPVIRFFQINQAKKGQFILKIVKNNDYTKNAMDEILDNLQKYVGGTSIEVDYVEEIPLVRTGKRSPVVSTVVEDFQKLDVSPQIRKSGSA
jgi:phenylacetate-CoA ligase